LAERIPDPAPLRDVRIEVSTKTILTVAALIVGLSALEQLWPIVILLICSLILVGTLNPVINLLERRGWRRHGAVAAVFLAGLSAIGLVGLLTVPALWREIVAIVHDEPRLQAEVANTLARHPATASFADAVRGFELSQAATGATASSALALSWSAIELLGYAGTSVVLAIYLLIDRERLSSVVYAIFPRRFHVRLARVLINLETIVGGYIRGQVLTSVAIAAFTFALLSVFGVSNALAIAAFAGLTDVLPFVGGILAVPPAVLSAYGHGTLAATAVLVGLVLYQEFESRVLVPAVYGRTLRLPPAAVVVALLVGAKLGGVTGALLALPAAAALRMLVEELRVDMPGDDSEDLATRDRDARAELDYEAQTVGATAGEAAQVAVRIAEQVHKDGAPPPPKE
jgi:predicted PurR-regulated permease PerM